MTKKLLGVTTVDSGQLIIIDPCYLQKWKNDEYNEKASYNQLCYSNACKASSLKNKGGSFGSSAIAIAFQSGLGDGVYRVYAYYKDISKITKSKGRDMRIAKIEIDLL